MGRTYEEYWSLTLCEINIAIRGYLLSQQRQRKEQWNIARWHAMQALIPHVKKGKNLTVYDLAIFPWEEEDLRIKKEAKHAKILEHLKKIGLIPENANFVKKK